MASETAEVEMKPVDNHVDPPKEAEEEDDEATPKKKAKRRRSSSEVAAEGTPAERPSRERKTVERYSAVSPKRASATKSLSIKQGSGTKLQDIPNVVFKLSKRKVDDNLQALHTLLFGRKSNVHKLKRNIFQFSGFVWSENEEKLRAKLKEKLDKYNKDKLTYFCELLDIHSLKASAKKEELTSKLLEFLESPHITRDVLLSEKDKKGKKRVRKTKGGTPTHRETKKKMKSSEPEVKKRKREPSKVEQQEDDDEDGSTGTKDASSDEEDGGNSEEEKEQVNSEDANDETEKPVTSKKGRTEKAERIDEPKIEENTSPVKEGSPAKSSKSPIRPASKKASVPVEDEPDMNVDSKHGSTKEQTKKASKATSREKGAKVKKEDTKKSQRKGSSGDVSDKGPTSSSKSTKKDKKKAKSKEKPVHKDKKARKKKEDKSRSRVPDKEQGKGKTNARPSTEELRSVISSILKEVDFNTATLADILKQLGTHFKIDLMDRKTEVKQIIEEVINSMTDDEDVDEDEDCEGDDKEGDQEEEASDEDGKE